MPLKSVAASTSSCDYSRRMYVLYVCILVVEERIHRQLCSIHIFDFSLHCAFNTISKSFLAFFGDLIYCDMQRFKLSFDFCRNVYHFYMASSFEWSDFIPVFLPLVERSNFQHLLCSKLWLSHLASLDNYCVLANWNLESFVLEAKQFKLYLIISCGIVLILWLLCRVINNG